jgi:endonuclease/exonuclease/phosphatase family metal-dependent hydrolase
MQLIKTLFSVSLLLLLSIQDLIAVPVVSKTQENECKDETNLKILSWNIYMLPAVAVRPGKRERAYAIVEELKKSDFDVIVFQEAFLPAARRIIQEGLKDKYAFDYGPANNEGLSFKTNSGIWVISNRPLEILGAIQFKDCSGIDCYARKGAMLLQGMNASGKPFQILGTHLQSENATDVREKQMDQIYMELLVKYRQQGVPQIVCGDLNTESYVKEHYCAMLDCLDAEDGDVESVEKCTYDGVNNEIAQSYGAKTKFTLDYILLRANGAKMKTVKRFVSVMKKGKKHLSDHYGVICEVKF